jgi:hypothetical protein
MWVLPSFNRPERCAIALEHIARAGTSTPGVVVVNGGTMRDAYERLALPPHWTMQFWAENVGCLAAHNAMRDKHPNEPFYGLLADDDLVLSLGWDEALVTAAGDWSIAYGNDGWQSPRRIGGGICVGGELARAIGYLTVPGCWHWFGGDDFFETIADACGLRRYCESVRIVHAHQWNPNIRAPRDATYDSGSSRTEDDRLRWAAWRRDEMAATLERIRKAQPK